MYIRVPSSTIFLVQDVIDFILMRVRSSFVAHEGINFFRSGLCSGSDICVWNQYCSGLDRQVLGMISSFKAFVAKMQMGDQLFKNSRCTVCNFLSFYVCNVELSMNQNLSTQLNKVCHRNITRVRAGTSNQAEKVLGH